MRMCAQKVALYELRMPEGSNTTRYQAALQILHNNIIMITWVCVIGPVNDFGSCEL